MNNQALLYVLVPVLAAILLNLAVYASGWAKMEERQNPLLPPGWVIGLVWIVLLGLLGYALFLAVTAKDAVSIWAIVVLLLVCVLYPLFTGRGTKRDARIANTVALIVAFAVAVLLANRLPGTLPFLAPLLLWVSWVNVADAVHP